MIYMFWMQNGRVGVDIFAHNQKECETMNHLELQIRSRIS